MFPFQTVGKHCRDTFFIFNDMEPEDWAVLELSSFQLMTMDRSPHIAVMTNLSPNHLDVHKSYGEYIAAKENVFTHIKRINN